MRPWRGHLSAARLRSIIQTSRPRFASGTPSATTRSRRWYARSSDAFRGVAHPRRSPPPPALCNHDTPQITSTASRTKSKISITNVQSRTATGYTYDRVYHPHLGDAHHSRNDTRRMHRPTPRGRALFLHRLPTGTLTPTSTATPPRITPALSTRFASSLDPGLPRGRTLRPDDFRQSGDYARILRPLRYSLLADSSRIILGASVAFGHALGEPRSRLRATGSRTEQGAPMIDQSTFPNRISHRPGVTELRIQSRSRRVSQCPPRTHPGFHRSGNTAVAPLHHNPIIS